MSATISLLPNVAKGEIPERNNVLIGNVPGLPYLAIPTVTEEITRGLTGNPDGEASQCTESLGIAVYLEAFSPWQRTTWIWAGGLVVIVALAGLAAYLLYSRRRLKQAEKKRLQLGGMLISAQEKERSRLASELHDDFSQRLALLAYGLENVAEAIPASAEEANRRLQNLAHTASEIGADLHTLSHRLHSSTLENLGLVPGVAALCKEFTSQQGITVDFHHEDIPRAVQPEVALCLFRIVQEGLRNLRKHSGAEAALVRLDKRGDDLHVVVGDKGIGFDVKELRERNGLGIRSMEERAQMLGGRFKIHSELGKGTRVEAWIPLRQKANLYRGNQ